MKGFFVGTLVLVLCLCFAVNAKSAVIDFENLAEFTQIKDQYAELGVNFSEMTDSNGVPTVLVAGSSLNEFDFPPQSGVNAVFDDQGAIVANFDPPVINAGGYFTYIKQVTLTAYDASGDVVGTATSAHSENYVSSENPQNELLSIDYAFGISRLEILGDPSGLSYVMDSFTFKPIPQNIILWPPTHEYHTIKITDCVTSVSDICDLDVDMDDIVIASVSSVSSDEPEDVFAEEDEDSEDEGDGNTKDDIVIVNPQTIKLRAERQGGGNGRVYTINYQITDAFDNTATGSCKISVPHEQNGEPAVDDGPEAGYTIAYP